MVSLGDAVHRPRLIERVFCGNLKEHLNVSGPVMLDSGGFTMMTRNRSLEMRDIARIYRTTGADLCVSLDVPPLHVDDRATRKQKFNQTQTNFEFLANEIGLEKLVPVLHGSSALDIGKNCESLSRVFPSPHFLCVGGLVPLLRRAGGEAAARQKIFSNLAQMIRTIRSWFSPVLIHVLGAGSPRNVRSSILSGADSTDSMAWRRAAGFGTIYLPGTGERFLAPRGRLRPTSRPTLSRLEKDLLSTCKCPACVESGGGTEQLVTLSRSYFARAAHNAFIIGLEATEARSQLQHAKQ
jgi:tRNA-guanine family transglycosylase